jgi:DeoR/GlpR family transcriptional regulator of sugar metabolism
LDFLTRRGYATLDELTRSLNASLSTIRRDLEYWQEQGLVKRIHGGAMFVGDGSALPALEERTEKQLIEKRAIAQAAASRIRDDTSVLIDGGTTTLELARLLVHRHLQVVTNSLPIAQQFAGSGVADLVLLGGYVYPKTGVALGPLVLRCLEDLHVQQTILSVSGITAKGLFNGNMLLVDAERRMMQCADEVMVIADHTKFGRQALAHLCELQSVKVLVTDSGIADEHRAMVESAGVELIVVETVRGGGAS